MKEKTSADELEANWAIFLEGSPDLLRSYLNENSNLPGPRGNLTLAERLSKLVSRTWKEKREYLIEALEQWRASDNEYLLFCYYSTLGHLMAHHPEEDAWAKGALYEGNFSKHWRAREAVTFAVVAMLKTRPRYTLDLLKQWNQNSHIIVLRNILVALADPTSLKSNLEIGEELRDYIHKAINIVKKPSEEEKANESYKLLKKSLGFVLSVAAMEDSRIVDDMMGWVNLGNRELVSIVKQNAKKNRFKKRYPEKYVYFLN